MNSISTRGNKKEAMMMLEQIVERRRREESMLRGKEERGRWKEGKRDKGRE